MLGLFGPSRAGKDCFYKGMPVVLQHWGTSKQPLVIEFRERVGMTRFVYLVQGLHG